MAVHGHTAQSIVVGLVFRLTVSQVYGHIYNVHSIIKQSNTIYSTLRDGILSLGSYEHDITVMVATRNACVLYSDRQYRVLDVS